MKKSFLLVLPFLLLFIISGCLFDSDDDKNDKNQDITDIDEAYRVIGYGYDITGNYADPTQIKGSVFEGWKLPQSYTVRTQINHSVFSTESGKTVGEYQEQLAVGLGISGSYKAFSGAVQANFSEEYYSINQTSFATVMGKINSYQIAIPSNYARADLLRPYMTSQAVKDLNDASLDPEEIFRMYGTHVLTGAVMGARLDFSVAMRSSDVTSGRSVAVLAEAEYSTLFASVNSSASFNSETEKRQYEEHRSRRVNAIGGRSEYAQDIISKNDYDNWISSIEGNEVFCDYTDNGLIPIWEFCTNADRKSRISAAFDAWLADHQIETRDAPAPARNCILDIQVAKSDNGASYHQNGLTYYKIDMDLNRRADGDFVYMYTAIGLDNTTGQFSPITNLVLVNGGSSSIRNSAPAGYTLVEGDLNSRAGGQFIYLCISRSPSEGEPVRSLEVWNKSMGSSVYSWGANTAGSYYDVRSLNGPNPLDLNKDAGGDFIYLLYSRD